MLLGLLRVKDEARWIGKVLDSISPVCDRILLMDDHSTDDTCAIAAAHGATVLVSPFEGIQEARDKDWLLQHVWDVGARVGDWCLMVDGDEALHPDDMPALRSAVESFAICCSPQVVYLWDREDQIRVDRLYWDFRRPSLFRLTRRDLTFQRTASGGNFHCSNVPEQLLKWALPIPVRLLHYGYMLAEDRIRKYAWYNRVDPDNAFEDCYRHVAQGDLPEIPAEAKLKWAGPLFLRRLKPTIDTPICR
jgi:glycosyltransferase involved in cell wall biosynthesis